MKLKANSRGFTLIELLVVIAIIGILAAIVLTSLNTARTRARDASAKASMSAMRAEGELNVDSGGNYPADLCSAKFTKLITAVEAQVTPNTVDCNDGAPSISPAWAAEVTLSDNTLFCVDSSGFAGIPSAVLGGTACAQ